MTPTFELFINDFVIPENWSILSSRFDVSTWTSSNQRLKIIGEIVEFHEALELYKTIPTPLGFLDVIDELADIIISCCTLIRLQGSDRRFQPILINHEDDPLEWVHMVYSRDTNLVISSVACYGRKIGINVEEAISRKLVYNMQRKDWN